MMHRQRTAVEAWVHQLQLEGSSTNGGIAPPAARADKQRLGVSATESASVMVPFTVANAAIRKNVAESAQGYESPARLATQELPELLERSAEAARFAQLQILSVAEERSFYAANGAFASGKSPLPASRSVMPRDAAFSVSGNPVAAASHNVAVTSSNCRTPVSLVSSPNSPPGSTANAPPSTPSLRVGHDFRQPSRFQRQPSAAATTKRFEMGGTEELSKGDTTTTSIPTMEVDGDGLNAEMLGLISSGNATASVGGSSTLHGSTSTGKHDHGRLRHDKGSHVGGDAKYLGGGGSSSQLPETTEWACSQSGDETPLEEFLRSMMGWSSNLHVGTNSDRNATVSACPDLAIQVAPEQRSHHMRGLRAEISLIPEIPLPNRGGLEAKTALLVTEPALPAVSVNAAQDRGPRGLGTGSLNVPRHASLVNTGSPCVAGSPTTVSGSPNLSESPLAGSAVLSTSMPMLSGEMALSARCADSRRTMSLPGENCILASAMVDLEEEALVQELLRSDSRGAQTGMLVDGGGLDGSGSAAAAGVEASAGVFSDGGNPVLGASNSSGDMAGGSQAQQTSLVRQQLGSPTMGDWRPRTRTRFDAEAKERGVIKPRSMRERKRRDKIR
ncbi:unnamed protein product [Closterium sp. NIES-53]